MTTAIFIIAAFVSGMAILLLLMKGGSRRERHALLKRFEEAVTENTLVISEKEVFRHRIIGLDRVNRKLLFVEREGNIPVAHCLNLGQMAWCRVVQHHGEDITEIADGGSVSGSDRLHRVSLACKPTHGGEGVQYLRFYDHLADSLYEMRELAAKALVWKQKIALCALGEPRKPTPDRSSTYKK